MKDGIPPLTETLRPDFIGTQGDKMEYLIHVKKHLGAAGDKR